MSPATPFVILLWIVNVIQVSAQDQNHPVAQELVGKWCYISRNATTLESMSGSCITMKSDGTYEMDLDPSVMKDGFIVPGGKTSDTGTWWVRDGLLFYHSDSQGEGSSRFQKANHPRIENMPVLIVNGIILAPASPRDPW